MKTLKLNFSASALYIYSGEKCLDEGCQLELKKQKHPLTNILDSTENKGPIILAFKGLDCPTTPTETKQEQTLGESFGGSPLKLQEFQVDINLSIDADGNVLIPLSTHEARKLVSLYNLCHLENLTNSTLPLWALCRGQASDPLVCMGVQIIKTPDQPTVVRQHKVICEGPYDGKCKLPKFQTIVEKHSCYSQANVKTHCYAQYDRLDAFNHSKATQNESLVENRLSLVLNLTWDKVTSILQTPPMDAKATVSATVLTGFIGSAAYHLFRELSALQSFVRGLQDGLIQWAVEATEISAIDRISHLINEVKLGDTTWKIIQDEEDGKDLKKLILEERKDLDFTEEVWNILKDCTCYRELVDCLMRVLNSLQNGELKPMVHKSNKSMLARLVRDSYHGNMVIPSLTGMTPLEILVEIGIAKLQRDYTNAFLGKELVTANHLSFFLQESLETPERIIRLEKLHHSLELVVLLEQFLSLPRATLSLGARTALKYYEGNSINAEHVFTIPLQTSSISKVFEKCQPSIWKADIVGKVGDQDVHTTCIVTSKPPFSHVPCKNDSESDDCHLYLTTLSESVLTM